MKTVYLKQNIDNNDIQALTQDLYTDVISIKQRIFK